jgi:hypothetical protein
MPRYFFDLYNDIVALDEEGVVLPNAEAAQDRGLVEAREMIRASVEEHNRIDLGHRVQIREEGGDIVAEVKFEDAVQFVRDGASV